MGIKIKMDFQLDSYCGLYCGACFIMTAYRQNRTDCLPDDWVSPIHDKEIKCYGCKSELVFENCRGCGIRKCAQIKKLEFCIQCSEFPCEKFNHLKKLNLAHHNVAIHSLEIIEKIGVQEWLKQQKERWICSNCGSPFSWYEQTCVNCGCDLFSSIKENKALFNILD